MNCCRPTGKNVLVKNTDVDSRMNFIDIYLLIIYSILVNYLQLLEEF